MSNINQEKLNEDQPIPVSIENTKKILSQMEKYICKIYLEKGEGGTGFFCKIPFTSQSLPVLITANHILGENEIKNGKIIKLTIYNKNNEVKKIEIDSSRKKYTNPDKKIDITIIEIKPKEDEIYNYLECDKNIYKNQELIDLEYQMKSIYILHYPKGKLNVSYGKMKGIIDNKRINHFCNTENGSSGGPILSLETFKVIGIHLGSHSGQIKVNLGTFIKYAIYLFNKFNRYKNEINLTYKNDKESIENIFGDKFVENNKNNIELIINGIKNNLISSYKLKKGENNIKIIIKNKIKNLEKMFYNCKSLINIKELEYLDTRNVNNFSCMFCGCSSLSNIDSLENWNVSNGNNFNGMLCRCSSLSDIKALKNWDVSNGKDFSYMLYGCSLLSDIKSLQKWNVSNGKNFNSMLSECLSLSDLNGLENWNISNGNNFKYMLKGCSSLKDLKELKNWKVSNGKDFSFMLSECSSLSDISSLENWNVSNGNNFNGMFRECSILSDIKALENWNVSNGNNFSIMFSECSSLSNIRVLKNWNVSNGNDFSYMFSACSSLKDLKGLENWNLSNGNNFSGIFSYCSLLSDISSLQNWNISNGINFSHMFLRCPQLSKTQIFNWNLRYMKSKDDLI